MINNIINNKNIKLYLKTFLILLLILFFLYLTNCYAKTENFEQNNTSQKNTITKNINNIEVPADFLPTHPWTNAKSGLDIVDNPQEHYLYEDDKKTEKYDKDSSQFTRNFTCRPSITGVFTDCGPYSFNACVTTKPSTSNYDISKDKKYRKHRNDINQDEEISIKCDRNICHHVYHHENKWINVNVNDNYNDNNNDNNNDNDNDNDNNNDSKYYKNRDIFNNLPQFLKQFATYKIYPVGYQMRYKIEGNIVWNEKNINRFISKLPKNGKKLNSYNSYTFARTLSNDTNKLIKQQNGQPHAHLLINYPINNTELLIVKFEYSKVEDFIFEYKVSYTHIPIKTILTTLHSFKLDKTMRIDFTINSDDFSEIDKFIIYSVLIPNLFIVDGDGDINNLNNNINCDEYNEQTIRNIRYYTLNLSNIVKFTDMAAVAFKNGAGLFTGPFISYYSDNVQTILINKIKDNPYFVQIYKCLKKFNKYKKELENFSELNGKKLSDLSRLTINSPEFKNNNIQNFVKTTIDNNYVYFKSTNKKLNNNNINKIIKDFDNLGSGDYNEIDDLVKEIKTLKSTLIDLKFNIKQSVLRSFMRYYYKKINQYMNKKNKKNKKNNNNNNNNNNN